MSYLVIRTPHAPVQRMNLEGAVIMGRAMGCELWIDDPKLSRHHCSIEPRGGEWFVTDLGSTNGTLIEGQRLGQRLLRDHDKIEAGNVRIEFCQGEMVVDRPANPIEAETTGASKRRGPSPADSTVVGKHLEAARVTKRPAAPVAAKRPGTVDKIDITSLPFTRPPARPMVKIRAEDSRWFGAILARFRRRQAHGSP